MNMLPLIFMSIIQMSKAILKIDLIDLWHCGTVTVIAVSGCAQVLKPVLYVVT